MNFEYDPFNRIQKMTYPDGEEVYYEYNLGGMLEKMSGNKNGVQYTYIDSIAYNEFELKEAVFYGNGTRAYYNYDVLQRLKHLFSECADGVMQDLYYDYDTVSNITSIGNHAGMLSNGLGGNYSNSYHYDNLYRLVHSDGEWDGDRYLHYDMDMSYLKNGRLQRKSLVTETWIDGNPTPINYDNNYSYDENHQPNTVRGIYGSHHHDMQWDVKGNLVRHRNHHAGYDRRLCWDEQNRLQGVKDDEALSFYMYDANGDRVYKLSGEFDRQNVSGMWWHFYQLNNATLYASPYVVATRHGYTKHYYAENERVASKIGGGGLHGLTMTGKDDFQELLQPELPLHYPSCIPNEDEFRKKRDAVTKYATEVARCLDSEIRAYAPLESLAPFSDILNEKPDCYWYHTDHLGSSSWITYTDGTAVEHLHYLPWGEDLVRQRHTNYHARYTFSAKEKDTETGYSYFGARYYSSELSIWLSVDPMLDKYPSLSPYVYCANNPVKLVDPNGEEIGIPPFLQRIVNGIKNKYNQVKSKFEDAAHEFFSTTPYANPTPLPSTINNDFEAMNVYFNGTGEPMSLSNELGNKVISTEQFQKRHQRILNGKTTSLTGNFTIDMTKEEDAFFIGRTRVDYDIKISSDKKRCTVTYTLFSNDGFWDPIDIGEDHNIGPTPDGAGPKRELPGGHPYSFKTQTRSYEFDNPGYDEK